MKRQVKFIERKLAGSGKEKQNKNQKKDNFRDEQYGVDSAPKKIRVGATMANQFW